MNMLDDSGWEGMCGELKEKTKKYLKVAMSEY